MDFKNKLSPQQIQNSHREYDKELSYLNQFLERMSWHINDNLEALIEPGDVIEVYDAEVKQLYRSFNFFQISSYSVQDLVMNEIWKLYERDSFALKTITNHMYSLFSKDISGIQKLNLGIQNSNEIWSEKKYTWKVEHKLLIPVYNSKDDVVAVIATMNVFDCKKQENA